MFKFSIGNKDSLDLDILESAVALSLSTKQ